MKTAIILHGQPSKEEYFNPDSPSQSNKHWLPWIQRELILRDILAQTPEMPRPYDPDYRKWKTVFEQFTLNQNTALIGHSTGAGFLLRWLSENRICVDKVALIAPWLNIDHEDKTNFFDFEIDPSLIPRVTNITMFISSDDSSGVIKSAAKIRDLAPGISVKQFTNHGHFTFNSMKTDKFPELLDALIQ